MDLHRPRTEIYNNLVRACKRGDLAEVRKLTSENRYLINIYDDQHYRSSTSDTPLGVACKQNNTELIDLLLSLEADINLGAGTRFPLTEAWQGPGGEALFDRLISLGASVNAEDEIGNSPLLFAAQNGFVDLIETLISRGASVNETRGMKHPLNVACKFGQVDVVDRLLGAGSTVNFVDHKGETPFTNAIMSQHLGIIDRLVIHGADYHLVDRHGCNPLHLACSKESTEIVDRLLGLGIDINSRAPNGSTSLMMATWNERPNVIKFLLEHGADRDLVDSEGKKAIDRAPDQRIKRLLES